jgi:hypothetical protein
MLKLGINHVSNEEYHADRQYLSSSVFKLIHKDIKQYHEKYVLKIAEEPKNSSALTFGTVAHLLLLEPHLFKTEVVVYTKGQRRGQAWDIFKSENEGKHILTLPEYDKLQLLFESYKLHDNAVKYLDSTDKEFTMCSEYKGINVKARADAISIDNGYILDVKTTGYDGDVESFKSTVDDLYYDLSGALYCLIAEQIYNKPFDFYFLVLSKKDNMTHFYKMSKATKLSGINRLNESIEKYNYYLKNGLTNEIIIDNLNTDEIQEV